MPVHIDYNDPRYAESAVEILRRHDNAEPEANITSAVRDFLVTTGLVRPSDIAEENPPAQGSRRAVDLTALDTFIEFQAQSRVHRGQRSQPRVCPADRRLPGAVGKARPGADGHPDRRQTLAAALA